MHHNFGKLKTALKPQLTSNKQLKQLYQKIKCPQQLTNFLAALILVAALFFPLVAKAQQVQDIVNQQDWITRQMQKKIEDNRRARQQEASDKDKDSKEKEVEAEQQDSGSAKAAECFPIKTIHLAGANSISKAQQKKLTEPFIGKCAETKVLAEIISTLQTYYKDHGYAVAQVSFPEQNIQTGNIEVKVLEGRIGKITLNDDSVTDKMQKVTAFGNIEGDTLNMDDLNQGLYQMNRLPSNNASITIDPSENEGEAKVSVTNKKSFPANATIGYDNLGNDYTGVNRTSFSSEIDNLLFLNDALNLSYTANLNNNRNIKDNKSFTADFSIPFGYYTFTYDYARSEFLRVETLDNITGFTNSNNFIIDRVLFTKDDLKITGNTSFNKKSAASYLNQHKIVISERELSIASIEFAVSNTFKNGTDLYVKPTYSKGLSILDAEKDSQDVSSNVPKAQFERFKLYATLSKKFKLPKLDTPVELATEMDSQYSKDMLFGSEQFSVGGYYSVRGFRDTYLTGNSGYYFRNTANVNIGSLILPLINKENPGYLTNLNKFKIEPFYDYGHVSVQHNDTSGRLSGAGVKTIFESDYFNASLTYSVVTSRSQLLNPNDKENRIVYFEISATCC